MPLRLSTGLQDALAGANSTTLFGPELVTNGALVTATGWTAVEESGTVTFGATVGGYTCCKILGSGAVADDCNSGTYPMVYQAITTEAGSAYYLAMNAYSYVTYLSCAAGVRITAELSGGEPDPVFNGVPELGGWRPFTPLGWENVVFTFLASGTTTYICLVGPTSASVYMGYRNLSVKKINTSIVSSDLRGLLSGSQIEIRTGSQPSDPDAAPTGDLLVTIKNGASGITFGAPSDGVLSKSVGETWSGTCVMSGTAGWFRICQSTDSQAYSTTDYRIDGTVATSGGQMSFANLAFTAGSTQTVSDFQPQVVMQG